MRFSLSLSLLSLDRFHDLNILKLKLSFTAYDSSGGIDDSRGLFRVVSGTSNRLEFFQQETCTSRSDIGRGTTTSESRDKKMMTGTFDTSPLDGVVTLRTPFYGQELKPRSSFR